MTYELEISPRSIKILPANEIEEILQNCLMILLTEKYSVPLDREFGVNTNIVDLPINAQPRITAEIAGAIRRFEPRARVRKVDFNGNIDGQLTATVELDIDEKNLRGGLK